MLLNTKQGVCIPNCQPHVDPVTVQPQSLLFLRLTPISNKDHPTYCLVSKDIFPPVIKYGLIEKPSFSSINSPSN